MYRKILRQQLCSMAKAAGLSVGDLARQIVPGSTRDNLQLLRDYHTVVRPHLVHFFDKLGSDILSEGEGRQKVGTVQVVSRDNKQQDGVEVSSEIHKRGNNSGDKKRKYVKPNRQVVKCSNESSMPTVSSRSWSGKYITNRSSSKKNIPAVTESSSEGNSEKNHEEPGMECASPIQVPPPVMSTELFPTTSSVPPPLSLSHQLDRATLNSVDVSQIELYNWSKKKATSGLPNASITSNTPEYPEKQLHQSSCSNIIRIEPPSVSDRPQLVHLASNSSCTDNQDDNTFLASLLFDDSLVTSREENSRKCPERRIDKYRGDTTSKTETNGRRLDKCRSDTSKIETNEDHNTVLDTLLFGECPVDASECEDREGGHTQASHSTSHKSPQLGPSWPPDSPSEDSIGTIYSLF